MKLEQQTTGSTFGAAGRKRKLSKWVGEDRFLPYVLVVPTLILIAVIMFFPILKVFELALRNYDMTRPQDFGFAGLSNFREILFHDELFPSSLWITVKWVVIEVVLQLVFGLIVALLLNQTFRFRGVVRSLVLIPWAVSGVLTTMLWSLMFNQHIGVINDLLKKLGIIHENIAWLANTHTVFGSVIVAELWRGIPFFAVALLAALQSIPQDIYESCDVDGAGKVRKLFSITLPYLKESIIFSTMLRAIWEFNSMDMIYTMTDGGPMNMTTTLPVYMFKTAILNGNYGYASAMGVITFFVLMIFVIGYLKLSRSDQDE
ncbi:carbohydrate ABC transporter permease [Paenibacillus hexagrammi]|uniref:Sugar ABC transporter permease n=1 Tax=Paenibacillus hexagrammi TaxID=2908839 RepID=A0ABY3SCK3_9BACL|nr:sugar ABC transporter permease [Paenibacillus sp. YPD9-1]UJF31728.1 sugar ABC transporter permease [Paenibacillus sp. YPD9-1]